MKNYRYINKNPLSCKDYKSLKTHKKLFPVYRKTYKNSRSSSSKHIINSYLEKIDENKLYQYIHTRNKTSIAVRT